MYYAQSSLYLFLVWNLFLAWLPLVISLLIDQIFRRKPTKSANLIILIALWLLLLPNTFYILTDFMHLRYRAGMPIWYDVLLLISFSWNGLILGITSLAIVQKTVKQKYGSAPSWIFTAGSIVISSIGVYIGRFFRWNSWDVILTPKNVVSDIIPVIAHPLFYAKMYASSLVLALFIFTAYLTVLFFHKWVQDT